METKENQLRNKIVDEIGLISFAKKNSDSGEKNPTIFTICTVVMPREVL